MTDRRRILVAAALLAAPFPNAWAAGHADAARPAQAASGAGRKGTAAAPMTAAQRRECLARQSRMRQQQAELAAARDRLDDDKAEIGRRGDALKARLETLDRGSAEAVTAYNDEAAARDRMIDAYQEQVAQFNDLVEAARAERDSYAKACGDRRALEGGEAAPVKGR